MRVRYRTDATYRQRVLGRGRGRVFTREQWKAKRVRQVRELPLSYVRNKLRRGKRIEIPDSFALMYREYLLLRRAIRLSQQGLPFDHLRIDLDVGLLKRAAWQQRVVS